MMHSKCFLFLLTVLFFCSEGLLAQAKKLDTTVTINNVGYKVSCSNKDAYENAVSVSPFGFKNTARSITFNVKGKLLKADIGDVNNDGYPDLVLCVYGVPNDQTGNVVCITSVKNESLEAIYFPNIYDNQKLREGYKGHDVFDILYGGLSHRFPVYKPGDADDKPTGGERVIQYQVVTENGRSSFKVLRSYEVAQ